MIQSINRFLLLLLSVCSLCAEELSDDTIKSGETPLRIYCLGDSITQANYSTYSWRYYLWQSLIQAGHPVDFVGTISENHLDNPDWPKVDGQSFDSDHDARWGWTANKVADHLPEWLEKVDADIALIHLGTNDILMGQGAVSTAADIDQIVRLLREDNPEITIFIAQIIPLTGSSRAFGPYNSELLRRGEIWNNTRSPVYIVDMYTAYDSAAWNYDGLHPSDEGEKEIASRWLKALRETGIIPLSSSTATSSPSR